MITIGLLELHPSVLSSRQKKERSLVCSGDNSFYVFSAYCVYMHCLVHSHNNPSRWCLLFPFHRRGKWSVLRLSLLCPVASVGSNSLWLQGLQPWILQARMLEWVAMPASRGSSWPRDRTCLLCLLYCRRVLYCWATRETHFAHLTLSQIYFIICVRDHLFFPQQDLSF